MPGAPTNSLLGPALRLVFRSEAAGLTDDQLLEAYRAERSEAAFETLVRRHGPMVLGVCRRVLGSPQDAEDAFQATFLVLARKAATIRSGGKLASWLYGVAYRAALKARALASRRRAREKQVKNMPEPTTTAEGLWRELEPLLDQELSHLPDRYRLPIVLCDLEGKTRKEAARMLGWPEGTVAGRIVRARALLAKRLAGHGLPLSGALLAALLSQGTASAGVSSALVSQAVQAAAGTISAPVAAIMKGVMKTMLLSKLKVGTVALLVAALLGVGARVLPRSAQAAGQNAAPEDNRSRAKEDRKETPTPATLLVKRAVLERVDTPRRSVSLTIPDTLANVHWNIAPGFTEKKRDGDAEREIAIKQARLEQAQASLAAEKATVELRKAEVQRFQKLVDAAAVEQRILDEAKAKLKQSMAALDAASATVRLSEVELAQIQDQAKRLRSTRLEGLPVAKDARITIQGKQARLTELKPGMRVSVRLATEGDRLVIAAIAAKE